MTLSHPSLGKKGNDNRKPAPSKTWPFMKSLFFEENWAKPIAGDKKRLIRISVFEKNKAKKV